MHFQCVGIPKFHHNRSRFHCVIDCIDKKNVLTQSCAFSLSVFFSLNVQFQSGTNSQNKFGDTLYFERNFNEHTDFQYVNSTTSIHSSNSRSPQRIYTFFLQLFLAKLANQRGVILPIQRTQGAIHGHVCETKMPTHLTIIVNLAQRICTLYQVGIVN